TLYVGNSAEGRLVVAGAEDGDGVVFTSRLGVTDEGSWGGIYIGGADRGSSFRFADISNGGGGGLGNLYVYGAPEGTVTLADSRVARSLNTGVYVQRGRLNMTNTLVTDNLEHGVWLRSGAAMARATGQATFAGNVVVGNAEDGVRLPAEEA